MIKLILIAFFCFGLSGSVYGHEGHEEDCSAEEIPKDDFDPNCLRGGSVHVKLSINVPPNACGCGSDENGPEEDLCLGVENSMKISDAVLYVLDANDHSYEVIDKLLIHRFIYGMEYNDFANNIKENDFEFEGFEDLKELVEKYRVCKKECKVYYTLRKALHENAANAVITEENNPDGSKSINVEGKIIILGDSIKQIQQIAVSSSKYTKVNFKATTFLADTSLRNAFWHGKHIRVETDNFLIALKTLTWDVSSFRDDEPHGTITIVGVQNWDRGPRGTNVFEAFPDIVIE